MNDVHLGSGLGLLKYRVGIRRFSKGSQGTVYRKGPYVVKLFSILGVLGMNDILEFRDLEVPDFYFAKAGIYVRKKLRGCITDYAEGHTIDELNLYALKIDTLLSSISRLEKAVDEITKEKIRIWDVHSRNILFDEDHFNIIDTISYYRDSFKAIKDLEVLNNKEVFYPIFLSSIPAGICPFFLKSGSLYESPYESVEKYIESLIKTLGINFKTLQEAENEIYDRGIQLKKEGSLR